MEWRKPTDKKFTDLCIYIDNNIEKLRVPGEYPEVENKIYNYLWLLVKALAIKKCMFSKFDDYDPFSFYAANRLFFALRKNLHNQGKTIKGKQIRPIKSCLNYTKALMYPMRIEYQREAYKEVIAEEFVSKKFDALNLQHRLQDSAREDQLNASLFPDFVKDSLQDIDKILEQVLTRSPFPKHTADYKHLKISMLITCLNTLKLRNKLVIDSTALIVWKLPKSISSYIKVLLIEFYTKIKQEIIDCYLSTHVDDATADQILGYREGVDYDYANNN